MASATWLWRQTPLTWAPETICPLETTFNQDPPSETLEVWHVRKLTYITLLLIFLTFVISMFDWWFQGTSRGRMLRQPVRTQTTQQWTPAMTSATYCYLARLIDSLFWMNLFTVNSMTNQHTGYHQLGNKISMKWYLNKTLIFRDTQPANNHCQHYPTKEGM